MPLLEKSGSGTPAAGAGLFGDFSDFIASRFLSPTQNERKSDLTAMRRNWPN
jgi:hypothetical protein